MNRRELLQGAPTAALAANGGSLLSMTEGEIRADFRLDPRRTAFINVDLQNCFVEGTLLAPRNARGLLRRLNAFAARCRSRGVLVVHTAHVLREGLANAGVMPEYIPQVRNGMITKGSYWAALHRDLVVDGRDIVLEKPRFGAFQGTDLEAILRTRGVESVIVGGIATNICCETTAREAQARDFKMFFLSDGTATAGSPDRPAEDHQAATCASLKLFGEVLTLDAMATKL
jgi:nicotinamidase-related amidase